MSMSSEVNEIIRDYEREVKSLYHKFTLGIINDKEYKRRRAELDEDCLWEIGNETKLWYKI